MNDLAKTKKQLIDELRERRQRVSQLEAEAAGRREVEEALRASEARHRAVVESQTELICRYFPDGTITFANGAYCRYFGKRPEELVGQTIAQTVPEEDCESVARHFAAFSPETPILTHEHRVIRPDGEIRWQRWTDRGIFDDEGNLVEIQGVGQDITDQKKVEKERDRFFNLSIDMLCVAGFDGFFKQVNPSWIHALGWSEEDLLSRPPIELVHPEDREATESASRDLIAGRMVYSLENRYLCKEGTYRWLAWNAFPVPDEQLIFAVARDVTKRKQSEEALRKNEEKYRRIVETSAEGIWLIDENGNTTFANSQMAAMLGYTGQEMAGTSMWDFMDEEWKEIASSNLDRRRSGITEQHEFKFRGKDGSEVWTLMNTNPIFDSVGKFVGALGMVTDITERKRVEEELRESREMLAITDRIAQIFLTVTDEEMYGEVLQVILDAMESQYGVFGFIDEDGALVVPSMTRDIWDRCRVPDKNIVFPRDRWGDSTWPRCLREKKVFYSNELSRKAPEGHIPMFRHISMPITYKGDSIGLFQVANKDIDYEEKDIQTLQCIADYVAPILHARLRREREEKRRKFTEEELKRLNERLEEQIEIRTLALRESEECFRNVFEQGPLGMAIVGLDHRWVAVNAALCEMVGHTEDDLTNLTFVDITHPEDIEADLGYAEKLARGEIQSYTMEKRCIRKNGEVIWINLTATVIHDDQGKALHFLSMIEDITDRKLAEQGLAEAHRFNETILASSPVGVSAYNTLGQCVSANEAMASIIGATKEQVLSQNFRKIESWKQSGLLSCAEEVLSLGLPKGCEVKTVSASGKEVWLDCRFTRFEYSGEPHLLLTVADLSKLRQAEAELRASERKYRELAELLPQLVYELDDRGFVTFLNDAGSRMTGYSREDLAKGVNIRDIFLPEDLNSVLQDFSSSLRGEVPPHGREYPVRRKDGSTLLMVVYGRPIRKGQRIVGLRGVAVDISERKKSEETIRRQSEFLRTVLESLTHPFCVVNSNDYTVSLANSAAIPASYSGEMTCYALFHGWSEPCNISEHPCPVEEVKRTKRPITVEHVHYDKDGTTRYVEVHTYPIVDSEGNVSQVIRYSLDITDRKKAEQALHESEHLLRTILSTSPVGIVLGKERKIQWANEAFREMFGFDNEREYLGQEARILYPSDEEYIHAGKVLYRDLETGRVSETDIQLRRKDGSVLYAHVKLRALDPLDPAKGIILAISDISSRKRAEIELQKLALIVQNASEFIALSDLDERLLFINEAGARMVGISKEKVGQYAILDCVPESYQDFVKTEVIAEILEKGRWEGALQLRHIETGKLTDVQAMTFLIPDPGTQQPLYLANVALDVTERRQAEEKLRESEQRYRSLFDHSLDGVYVTTRDGRFVEANQSLLDIYGFSREELMAVNVADLYDDPGGRAKFRKEIERWGRVKDYPVKLRKKDGKKIDCLLSASLWNDESGQILGYQGILRDVTESKRLEEQLRQAQKMESLGAMAGGIAHDFNNLLTIILGYSELLLASKTENDPDYEDLRRITSTAERGGDLVRRILTFSRKAEYSPRPIDLNREVKQSKKLLERTIPKMIAIDLHLADDLKRVHGDPAQIEQALLNLAVNAQHAMPEGGTLTLETENVTLDEEYCRTHLEAEPGRYVLLSVSDTGHGMEEDVLEHIFEPFYTTKKAGEGTGLGLAMVYGIITGHGGRISCYSEPGHGTTFKMYLPAIEKETGSIAAALEELIKGGTETILLVDDEDHIRTLGKRILSQAGYGILTAENGQKALEVYRSQREGISLVILDLIMPQMGGNECLEELLKIDPEAKVLVASGFSPNGPTKVSVQARARGFVGKPYNVTQLLQTVRKVLDEG